MFRVEGRAFYLARHEGALTRGNVKRIAQEWIERQKLMRA
jgi:hypothetical protein